MNKKVTIGVVLFGTKYLNASLPSLMEQTYENIEFIFHDQEEGKWSAYEYIKRNLPEVLEKASVTKHKNLMHSGGHNAILKKAKGEYYFCCSNDMLYSRDFVEKMVRAMEENKDFDFASPKIYRWGYGEDKEEERTKIIDSFGVKATDYGHFFDIGQGEQDNGQYEDLKEIWGVSGACGVYRMAALREVAYHGEVFDKNLHYKNDVDLSFRLRWAGKKALLVSDAVVYHDRQVSSSTKKSKFMIESSFLGDKIILRKNYSWDMPKTILIKTYLYHFLKTVYLLARHPWLFKTYKKLHALRHDIKAKRQK